MDKRAHFRVEMPSNYDKKDERNADVKIFRDALESLAKSIIKSIAEHFEEDPLVQEYKNL